VDASCISFLIEQAMLLKEFGEILLRPFVAEVPGHGIRFDPGIIENTISVLP
jgi:hypothetical protein